MEHSGRISIVAKSEWRHGRFWFGNNNNRRKMKASTMTLLQAGTLETPPFSPFPFFHLTPVFPVRFFLIS